MSWLLILASSKARLCPDQFRNPLCKINIFSCTEFIILLLKFLISNFSATFWSWINILDIFYEPCSSILQKNYLKFIPKCFLGRDDCQRVRRSSKVYFSKEVSLGSPFRYGDKPLSEITTYFGGDFLCCKCSPSLSDSWWLNSIAVDHHFWVETLWTWNKETPWKCGLSIWLHFTFCYISHSKMILEIKFWSV